MTCMLRNAVAFKHLSVIIQSISVSYVWHLYSVPSAVQIRTTFGLCNFICHRPLVRNQYSIISEHKACEIYLKGIINWRGIVWLALFLLTLPTSWPPKGRRILLLTKSVTFDLIFSFRLVEHRSRQRFSATNANLAHALTHTHTHAHTHTHTHTHTLTHNTHTHTRARAHTSARAHTHTHMVRRT